MAAAGAPPARAHTLTLTRTYTRTRTRTRARTRTHARAPQVIDDYAAGAPAKEVNGVAVVAGGSGSGAKAGAGAGAGAGRVGQALLGELAGQYRKCASCNKILQKCLCEGPRAWRAGGLTPRGGAGIVGEGGEGGGCGGGGVAVAVGGFTHGRSGSAGSDDAGGGWSSDSGTCPHCPSPPSCRVWFLRIPAALDRPALSARIDVT